MDKIEINSLPNSRGSIFALGLWGLIIGIIGGMVGSPMLGFMGSEAWLWISTGLGFIGLLMQFFFFLFFANACKSLGNSTFNQCAILAYSLLLFAVLKACNSIFRSDVFLLISLIPALIELIIFIVLAVKFKRNYSGLLGRVGAQMLKLIKIACIIIGIVILYVLILFVIAGVAHQYSRRLPHPSLPYIFIILGITIVGLSVWLLIATVKLYSTMDELMVYGYDVNYNSETSSHNLPEPPLREPKN
ncbi:MAG: hypothetical protein J1E97_03195 [Muribaculaceae bacterium]|nr:hypothetical protein [Muribaculaceae bacterium]